MRQAVADLIESAKAEAMISSKKLRLRINMAMTIDGRVALPDGRWYGLTSDEDRRRMDCLRLQADALIMGSGSINRDDPSPGMRVVAGDISAHQLPRVVLICRNSLPDRNKKVFYGEGRSPLVLAHHNLQKHKEEYRGLCEFEFGDDSSLLPLNVLRRLEKLGFQEILLEGGPRLNYAFVNDGLVDIINVTIVPFLLGQHGIPGLVDGKTSLPEFNLARWQLFSMERVESEIFIEYHRDNSLRQSEGVT